MTNNILVYHHLGLGDHIICAGIIREIYDQYDNVHLFAKQHNVASVKDLYADLPHVFVIPGDDNYANLYINRNQNLYSKVLKIGFSLSTSESFEQQFYNQANLNLNKKWDNFIYPYNYNLVYHRSRKLFNNIDLRRSYVFVHDDDRFKIDDNKIEKGKYIFRVSEHKTKSILEYADIILNAAEIHVIDSAFLFLIDCWNYKSEQKLFIHRYARHNDDWLLPTLRKNWIIL